MDCIILVGGFGTRLKKTVPNLPKPLAPINNQPFLNILLNQIEKSKIIDRVIFSLGYRADLIIDFIKQRSNKFESIFINEQKPLKTGGAIQNCISQIKSSNFFVMNGDSFLEINWHNFLTSHQNNKAYVTIACISTYNTSRFGTIEIDEEQRIVSFTEKQSELKYGMINGGIYCFKKGYLPYHSIGDVFSLETELFPQLIGKNIYAFKTSKLFMDIGTAESYELAKQKLAKL